MSQDFYQRERQIKQHEERQRAQLEKHQTLETWHLEQEAAQQSSAPPAEEQRQAQQSLLSRVRKLLRLK
jgi:hypothetical protein